MASSFELVLPETQAGPDLPDRPPADPLLQPGTIVGDFEIEKFIDQGGAGEVYAARQLNLGRRVALKVLSEHIAANKRMLKRFRREVQVLARLDHPHIVRILGTGEHDGRPFAALEYVDGRSLDAVIGHAGQLEVADTLHIAMTCAWALEHAHRHGIIHRDVKPANVLVSRQGLTKLADFGIVRQLDSDMSMTATGAVLGTVDYMAPEQTTDSSHASPASDIYSLGVVLYDMLTGRLPFGGETSVRILDEKKSGRFVPARSLNRKVSERLDLILHRMLTPNPAHRYPSCSELIVDLAGLRRHGESLSFASGDDVYVAIGPWSKLAQPEGSATSVRSEETHSRSSGQRTPTANAQPDSEPPDASPETWYVAHENKLGKSVVSEMTVAELILALDRKLLPVSAQARRDPLEQYRSLTHFAELHPALKRRGVRIPRSAAGRKKQASRKAKKRRDRRKERNDLIFRVAVSLFAVYGLLRGITDIAGLFEADKPTPQVQTPNEILDHL